MCFLKYKKLAYQDLMCKCYNRNFLEDKLIKKYLKGCIYITIIDIDNFKGINDTYGHIIGDDVLRSLVATFEQNKLIDYICRYGGDEFVIFHRAEIDFRGYKELFRLRTKATFSCGTIFKDKNTSFNEVISLADKQLYKEKGSRK